MLGAGYRGQSLHFLDFTQMFRVSRVALTHWEEERSGVRAMFGRAARGAGLVSSSGRRWFVAVVAAALVVVGGQSQAIGAGLPKWWKPPANVQAMLSQISSTNLQADDTRLVGFGTRHTLSSQTDPVRGIGAAGDWIFGQLQQDAAASGGGMTVQKQSFVQPVGPRLPVPTTITNIVATLQGTDPTATDRVYVVCAHYDDRVTDVLDFTSDAPGADRDGSGVAAMLELARVLAQHPATAPIVFAVFAGE